MKKNNRFLTCFMLAVVAACSLWGISGAARAEAKNPSLDVIVVMDFSFSTFPGYNKDPYDKDLMSLDATAMLLNMCEVTHSQAAIVPFTDGQSFIHDYNEKHGKLWNTWIDMSDRSNRQALCDSLFQKDIYDSTNARVHQGYSDYSLGMQQACALMERSRTGNQTLVFVTGDGIIKPTSDKKIGDTINYANQIKNMGGRIYCLQFGNKAEGYDLFERMASSSACHWSGVRPEDIRQRFSEVFAEMIGSTPELVYSNEMEKSSQVEFDIRIPHRSVNEVNLVVDKSRMQGNVRIVNPSGATVNVGPGLIQYTNDNYVRKPDEAYGYISFKILDPEAGIWKVLANRASSADGKRLTIDLLYNYQIELDAGLVDPPEHALYYKNQKVAFESYFYEGDGARSDDNTLYDGRQADGTGIQAVLHVIDANGQEVFRDVMLPDPENGRFYYEINLETADFFDHDARDGQTFSFRVDAEGDYLFRETDIVGDFSVQGQNPMRLTNADVDLGTIMTGDILNGAMSEPLFSDPLSNYFIDPDGDELIFVKAFVGNQGIVKFQTDKDANGNERLKIWSDTDGNQDTTKIEVYAQDRAGNQSQPVYFTVRVVSIKHLIRECVTAEITPTQSEPVTLNKGDSHGGRIELHLKAVSDEFPYNQFYNVVDWDTLYEHTDITYSLTDNAPDDVKLVGSGADYEVTANGTTGKFSVNARVQILGKEDIEFTTAYEIVNRAPELATIDNASGDSGPIDRNGAEPNPSVSVAERFTDPDGQYDHLTYYAEAVDREDVPDKFAFARRILAIPKLIQPDGPVVSLNTDAEGRIAGDVLNITSNRCGTTEITLRAEDEDGASVTDMAIVYTFISSRENMMCWGVYGAMAALALLLLGILFNRLVIHRPWPRSPLNTFTLTEDSFKVLTDTGEPEGIFGRVKREGCRLTILTTQFKFSTDDTTRDDIFEKVFLWPTTGSNLYVQLVKGKKLGKDQKVKVNGDEIKGGKKKKWRRNQTMTINYKDNIGNPREYAFRRK